MSKFTNFAKRFNEELEKELNAFSDERVTIKVIDVSDTEIVLGVNVKIE